MGSITRKHTRVGDRDDDGDKEEEDESENKDEFEDENDYDERGGESKKQDRHNWTVT